MLLKIMIFIAMKKIKTKTKEKISNKDKNSK